ncbi:MAB_1171c family putative transporter [Kitasatospora sp. NPDC101235]|uniref:MAB_1171c family putative transporter n=1 Tax=Kitasatospora sp. NPDC101235 TaxID=3364101 RepID=UPI003803AE01
MLVALGLCRWFALRGGRSTAALRSGYRFVLCLGAAMAVLAPGSVGRIERWSGVPGLATLVGDCLRLGAGCFLGLLSLELRQPPVPAASVRRHTLVAAAVAVAAVVLFRAADPRYAAGDIHVAGVHRLALAGYDALITVYVACCLGSLSRQIQARAGRTEGAGQRLGMRLIAWGTRVGVAWTAWGLDDVRQALGTGRQAGAEDGVSVVLGVVCTALVVAGATVGRWGRGLPALRRWLWAHLTYRELARLWHSLYEVFPEIALRPPGRRGPGRPPGDIQFALYRRIIEINDGLLALRPFLEPASEGPGVSTPPDRPDLPAEPDAQAAAIVRALGRAGAGPVSAVPPPFRRPLSAAVLACLAARASSAPAGSDRPGLGIEREAAHLAAVSRAFGASRPLAP